VDTSGCARFDHRKSVCCGSFGTDHGPTHIASDFRFAGTKTLSDRLSTGFNLGAEWDGEIALAHIFYSYILGFRIISDLAGFAELYGYVNEEDTPDHRFDAGLTYLVAERFQLDFSAGLGLNEKAPDWFISAGMSLRLFQ